MDEEDDTMSYFEKLAEGKLNEVFHSNITNTIFEFRDDGDRKLCCCRK